MTSHLFDFFIDLATRIGSRFRDLVLPPEALAADLEVKSRLAGYALGWKEGLEAAKRDLSNLLFNEYGFERDVEDVEKDLISLSLTPWPGHPEYGWKSESESRNQVIGTPPLQPVYESLDELYATRDILENCRCAAAPLDVDNDLCDLVKVTALPRFDDFKLPAKPRDSDPSPELECRGGDDICGGYPV